MALDLKKNIGQMKFHYSLIYLTVQLIRFDENN